MDNTELCERLQALADSLVGDEWDHPLLSVDTCRETILEIDRLNKEILELRSKLEQAQQFTAIENRIH